jgi:drug/metabolite transporter (DMT)-like permease
VSAADNPSPRRAALMLVVVTLFWGLSFPLVKSWQDAAEGWEGGPLLSAVTLIALRTVAALGLLIAVQPRLVRDSSRREHLSGAAVGLAVAVGFVLQAWGLGSTTPALSAFITALSSAWVPLLAYFVFRTPVAGITVLGLAVGVVGTAVLGLRIDSDEGLDLKRGDVLTLIATLLFAAQVLLLDRLGKRVRPAHMTVGFLGVTALLALGLGVVVAACGPGIGAWLRWAGEMLGRPAVLRDLTVLVLFPTVFAFHWMNRYQPHVSAGRAALIYLLEPVFAAAFSVLWGHDQMTGRLFLGGGLILAGNLLIEVPYWLRQWRGGGTESSARQE